MSVKTLELPEQEDARPQTPPPALPTKQPSSYRLVIQNGNVVDVVKVREKGGGRGEESDGGHVYAITLRTCRNTRYSSRPTDIDGPGIYLD